MPSIFFHTEYRNKYHFIWEHSQNYDEYRYLYWLKGVRDGGEEKMLSFFHFRCLTSRVFDDISLLTKSRKSRDDSLGHKISQPPNPG